MDYNTIAANALAAIQDAGSAITVTRSTVASFDPTLGTVVPGADLTASGYGVMANYSNYNIDGTVVKRGDMRLLIAPGLAFNPAQNDRVLVDGVTWNIVNVEEVNPAGTECLFKCQVRK